MQTSRSVAHRVVATDDFADASRHPPTDDLERAGHKMSAPNGDTAHMESSDAPAHALASPEPTPHHQQPPSVTSGASPGSDASLQLVDETQHFNDAFREQLQQWHLYDKGFNYNVVAVFGSQSTGKSTLLNRLFGTRFAVMNEADRRQTTKGIWLAKADGADMLVMDVEGTDGRERGEDQDFERKSALFSMATAEVVLVNLWEHQVGLYQGANMGLLKTVMEVNLGLFQAAKATSPHSARDKALLLFIIRDHIGTTPLQNLRATLTQDLERLWDGLNKPEGLEQSKISDFFDLAFATLPHKLLQPERFEAETLELKKRFVDPKSPDYVFKPIYHKRIPADGVAPYMAGIWEQVLANKDLDLPTQQELLAQFRCDELASAALIAFTEAVKKFARPLASGAVLDELGKLMLNARMGAIASFDRDASRYHAGVYQRKRADFVAKMNSDLSPLFLAQLTNLHKLVIRDFKASITEALKREGYDFAAVIADTRKVALGRFRDGADAVLLPDTEWEIDDPLAQFEADLDAVSDQCRADETKRMLQIIERNFKKQIGGPLEVSLNKPAADMWDKVLLAFKEALSKAEATYIRNAKSFNATDAENEAAVAAVRRRAWLALRAKIEEQTADTVLLAKLKFAFEDRFRYDSDGVPRIWRPSDDIDALFRAAREEVLDFVGLYAQIKPADDANSFDVSTLSASVDLDDDADLADTLTVLSETKRADIASKFRREADAYYVEAKRSMVSSISQIPYWMYGVLAILGWNEFVAVLRSPVYFTMVALLAGATYVTFRMNMQGPVLAIARGTYDTAVRVAHDKLAEHFHPEALPPTRRPPVPVSTMQGSVPEEIEMKAKAE